VSQIALGALAAWVLVARRAGRIPPLQAPLLVPIAAFAAWSLVAALASERPLESFYESKHLLNLAALFVLVNALDAATARRFAIWLLFAVTRRPGDRAGGGVPGRATAPLALGQAPQEDAAARPTAST
jgi:hypothetical protein